MINHSDIKGKVKDVIYLDDIRPQLETAFKDGFKMGETTYFQTLDNHFRLMKGHTILFGGMANYGKSKFLKQVCLLRAITSEDGMTADYYEFKKSFMQTISNKIVNSIRGINRVVYDVTSKPPSTIELE